MKRFNFPLEKVLDLRRFREEETRVDLGLAIGILSGIENEIKTIAQAKSMAALQRVSGLSAGSNLLLWDNYINRLDHETEILLKKAAEAELIVEEKRSIYLEASRDFKIMENLKERKQKEHRKEYYAAETREMDDQRQRAIN
jgi:flagellar FliJ protein